MPLISNDKRYRALQARDRRFDGVFFVGVTSTGIYCRPVCPSRTPKETSCRFFDSPATAEVSGFRPCLRCRPELAPHVREGHQPAERLAEALRTHGDVGPALGTLAAQQGVSPRHLRRLFAKTYGMRPVAYAQTQRLLFAKRLLQETTLPITEVALSAGFGSVRRFNHLFRQRYQLVPTALRRDEPTDADTVRLRLDCAAPLPTGLRVPGAFSAFEVAVRAIVGQRVSVAAARTVLGRLTEHLGEPFTGPGLTRLFPTEEAIATASMTTLRRCGLSPDRAATLQGLAQAQVDGRIQLETVTDIEAAGRALDALPGIGHWTVDYITSRAWRWPDAMPTGDLVLQRMAGVKTEAQLRILAEAWRPWRGYAAIALWWAAGKEKR